MSVSIGSILSFPAEAAQELADQDIGILDTSVVHKVGLILVVLTRRLQTREPLRKAMTRKSTSMSSTPIDWSDVRVEAVNIINVRT